MKLGTIQEQNICNAKAANTHVFDTDGMLDVVTTPHDAEVNAVLFAKSA